MEPSTAPNSVAPASRPSTSLLGRFAGIYVAPREIYDEIRELEPRAAHWVLTMILSILVGVASVQVIFSQPAILDQAREQRVKQVEQQLARGKIQAHQAERTRAAMENLSPALIKILGSVGALIGSVIWFLILTTFLACVGRWGLGVRVPFSKWLEIVGLANVIPILGGIVGSLLMVIQESLFASASPVIFLASVDLSKPLHAALASLNVFTLWYLSVLSIGVARVASVSFARSAAWLFGSWMLLRAALILTGVASSGM